MPELLASGEQNLYPFSWSADGRFLLYGEIPESRGLWTLRAEDVETALYYEAPGVQGNAVFSPNGNWVAYQSTETGQHQIWVQPFPATGARTRITDVGGVAPMWSPDGQELFYVNEVPELVSVAVDTESAFTFSRPESLPVTGTFQEFQRGRRAGLDITPDGQQFLVVRRPEQTVQPQINIVLNWFEELKEKVPVP